MLDAIIILGSGEGPRAIRSTLLDLAALGLTRPVLWADPAADPVSPGVIEQLVRADEGGARARRMSLTEATRTIGRGRVVLIALDEPDERGSTLDSRGVRRFTDELDHVLPTAAIRVHLYLPRLPLPQHPPTTMPGWTLLVLSPEDSASPGSAREVQYRNDGPDALGRYATPALVGMMGLWSHSTGVPICDGPTSPVTGEVGVDAESARLVRVFHRHIDATEVERQLRTRVFEVGAAVPLPRLADGHHVVTADNPTELNRTIANAFADRIVAAVTGSDEQETPDAPVAETAGFFQQFTGYFIGGVCGNSRQWFDAATDTSADDTVAAVHRVIGSTDGDSTPSPSVRAAVRTLTSTRPQVLDSVAEAVTALRTELDSSDAINIGPPPTVPTLWRTYTATVLSLLDGQDRAHSLGPVRDANNNPVVVPQPVLAAPDVAEFFDGAHPTIQELLGDTLGSTIISPVDPHGAAHYAAALRYAASQTTDQSIARISHEFTAWRDRYVTSFAWQVGQRLSTLIQDGLARTREAYKELGATRTMLDAFTGNDDVTAHRGLIRTMRSVLSVWVMMVLGCGIAVALSPGVSLMAGFGGIVLATVVGLAAQLAVFAHGRSSVVTRIAQRRAVARRHAAAARSFLSALADLDRAIAAYRHHQVWSTIIGRAVHHPFGATIPNHAPPVVPSAGLPQATVITTADAAPTEMRRAVRDLRGIVFTPDWAETALTDLLSAATAEVEQHGEYVPTRSELFNQPASGTHSVLVRLAQAAANTQLPRADTGAVWSTAVGRFLYSGPAEATQQQFTRNDLLADVLNTDDAGFFRGAVSAVGCNHGATEVDRRGSVCTRFPDIEPAGEGEPASATLSQAVTVVQCGHSVRPEWFVGSSSSPEPGLDLDVPGQRDSLF